MSRKTGDRPDLTREKIILGATIVFGREGCPKGKNLVSVIAKEAGVGGGTPWTVFKKDKHTTERILLEVIDYGWGEILGLIKDVSIKPSALCGLGRIFEIVFDYLKHHQDFQRIHFLEGICLSSRELAL